MAIRVDGWFRQAEDGNFLRQIHLAVHNRHLIKFNLERFHCPNAPDHFGRSPLVLAILTSSGLRELKVLIDMGADVNYLWMTKYPYGIISPLGIAIRFKDLELVKFLLEYDADPNLRLFEGNTALHLAVILDELLIVDALLEAKADPHVKNNHGYTSLHLAAIGSNIVLRRILKSSNIRVLCGPNGETPLHMAAQANNVDNVKLLSSKLGHVNFEMQNHLTPYECAPRHSKVRQFLSDLDLGAARQRRTGWKPFSTYFPKPLIKLMEAIRPILLQVLLDEDSIVKQLLPKDKPSPADSTTPTSEFCPPIKVEPQWYWIPYVTDFPNPCILSITSGFSTPTLAADYVHTTYDEVFEKLKNGEIMDEKEYSLCFMTVVKCWGAFANAYEALALGGTCLDMLLKVGADVNTTDEASRIPLHVALDEGYESLAVWLIKSGADVTRTTQTANKTPLMMATVRGLKDAVALMVDSGVDVDVGDINGASALHIAAYYSLFTPPSIIKSLTAAGAKVNARGPSNLTPLHLSATSMSPDRCNLLLNAGAYIDLKALGLKPVDMAFLFMNIPAAIILKLAGDMFKSAIKHDIKNMEKHLMRGANVNCQRSDYGTPLITLSRPNYTFHTILLLKYNPDYQVADRNGLTAFHWAVQNKNYCTLTMYLKKWGIDMLFEAGNPHHIDNLIRIARKSTKSDSVMPGETEYVLNSWKACYDQFGPERLERLVNKQFFDYVGFATILLKHGWNNAKAYFEGRVCGKEKPKI